MNNTVLYIYQTVFFGFFGYLLIKSRCEPASLLIGFVLGPMLEEYLRRGLVLSCGSPLVFIERPVSAVLLGINMIVLVAMLSPKVRHKKDEALAE